MPSLKLAHIHEQGNDMIIVPLESSFGNLSNADQNDTKNELQARANDAGLAGIVVPVWTSGSYFYFIAPSRWQGFFKSINMRFVAANINKTLSW